MIPFLAGFFGVGPVELAVLGLLIGMGVLIAISFVLTLSKRNRDQ